jgi:hypothetical protein
MSRHMTLLSFPSLVLDPGMKLVESKLLDLDGSGRVFRVERLTASMRGALPTIEFFLAHYRAGKSPRRGRRAAILFSNFLLGCKREQFQPLIAIDDIVIGIDHQMPESAPLDMFASFGAAGAPVDLDPVPSKRRITIQLRNLDRRTVTASISFVGVVRS